MSFARPVGCVLFRLDPARIRHDPGSHLLLDPGYDRSGEEVGARTCHATNLIRLDRDIRSRRLEKPEDAAKVIAVLVGSDRYLTGQNFFVDGGLFMH